VSQNETKQGTFEKINKISVTFTLLDDQAQEIISKMLPG